MTTDNQAGSAAAPGASAVTWPVVRRLEQALKALRLIIADPYGCRFCDSGKLRNPSKDHDEACGFAMADDDGP